MTGSSLAGSTVSFHFFFFFFLPRGCLVPCSLQCIDQHLNALCQVSTTWLHQSHPPPVSAGFVNPGSTLAGWGQVAQPIACCGSDPLGSVWLPGLRLCCFPRLPAGDLAASYPWADGSGKLDEISGLRGSLEGLHQEQLSDFRYVQPSTFSSPSISFLLLLVCLSLSLSLSLTLFFLVLALSLPL